MKQHDEFTQLLSNGARLPPTGKNQVKERLRDHTGDLQLVKSCHRGGGSRLIVCPQEEGLGPVGPDGIESPSTGSGVGTVCGEFKNDVKLRKS